MRESAKWRLRSQENLPQRAAGAHLLEVSQDRLAGLTNERVFLNSPLFGTGNRNHFPFPVHIFQARAGDGRLFRI
jgi:hypothetical protein